MELKQREDFNGRIAKRAKLANENDLSISQMISTIAKGDVGIDEHFAQKREKPVEEHKSLLNEFQL